MVPNAMASRALAGSHPATTFPEDCPFGRTRVTLPWASAVSGLLGTITTLPAAAGDLVGDALEHGEPQREDDGGGALQRARVGPRPPPPVSGSLSYRLTILHGFSFTGVLGYG